MEKKSLTVVIYTLTGDSNTCRPDVYKTLLIFPKKKRTGRKSERIQKVSKRSRSQTGKPLPSYFPNTPHVENIFLPDTAVTI
jgi:hypothetical protein